MGSIEEWRWHEHVRSQERSGLSQAEYCEVTGVSRRELARWRRRAWREALAPLPLAPVVLAACGETV